MLRALLVELVAVVALLVGLAALGIVGRQRLGALYAAWRVRLRASGGYLVGLAVLLAINSVLRDVTEEFSLFVGWNITGAIEALEGDVVVLVQSTQTEWLTTLLSYVYVHGYVFLLVFPLVAYLALEEQTTFRKLVVAYGLNYLLGTALYVVFIAFGPRNVGLVDSLLYTTFPEFQSLTSEINNPTNVFPSLHTSLSATAAIFAYRTRDSYPGWVPVASVLAGAVMFATMYLGLHWATDVVAGVGLAVACVYGADRYVRRQPTPGAGSAASRRWTASRLVDGAGRYADSLRIRLRRWIGRGESALLEDDEAADPRGD